MKGPATSKACTPRRSSENFRVWRLSEIERDKKVGAEHGARSAGLATDCANSQPRSLRQDVYTP